MLLDDLNVEQRLAAECNEGPVLIIAGAGSGKTRTLTYRIAHLIEKGVDPFNILALTFTNKAANEMKERISELVGDKARYIWMGTFHSVFSKILRIEADRLGYLNTFTVYDSEDSKGLIRSIVKEFNLDEKVYNKSFILGRISMSKSNLISAQDYIDNPTFASEDRSINKPYIGQIYREYNSRLRRAMAMDFDDLLFNMNVLLRDYPDLLLKYQEKFKYILVDEYQDTNYSQYYIIKKLSARYRNICVVGDDAQSIYAFRGANIRNILDFQKDYPDSKTFKLEQNYRSTKNIVNAANSVIERNIGKIEKKVWTDNDLGKKINYKECDSDKNEAKWICNTIVDRKLNDDAKYKDFAILYRTNQQSRSLEESLRFMNIPYRIFSGVSFYGRKEIKDVLSYFRLVVNNFDDEAFLRIINFPSRGIGETSLNKLKIIAAENSISLFEAAMTLDSQSGISTRTVQLIIDFVTAIRVFTLELSKIDAFELGVKIISKSGIIKFLKNDEDPISAERIENVEELINALQAFVESEEDAILDELTGEEISLNNKTLDVFVQQVSLMSESDRDDDKDDDRVSLMTIHSAKGLEFPYVFVCGMEENLFPNVLSLGSRVELEEERRLFYVAMTRAKKELALSCAQMRFRNGQMAFNEKSRFLDDVDPKYLSDEFFNSKSSKKSNPFAQETNFGLSPKRKLSKIDLPLPKPIGGVPVESMEDFSEGMEVCHDKFGLGKIVCLEGKGDDMKAEVMFESAGLKKLVLRFAKLKLKK
ncbi:MAG: UvrD-helicase domain-containing protein [Bacteroidales bacterium]|nr:3'-5' exonuclease [Bacteroidales bacterium]